MASVQPRRRQTAEPSVQKTTKGQQLHQAFQNNSKFYSHTSVLQVLQEVLNKVNRPYDEYMSTWITIEKVIAAMLEEGILAKKTPHNVVSMRTGITVNDDLTFRLLAIQHQFESIRKQPHQPNMPSKASKLATTIWLLLGIYHEVKINISALTTAFQKEILLYSFKNTVILIFNEYLAGHENDGDLLHRIKTTRAKLFIVDQNVSVKNQGNIFPSRMMAQSSAPVASGSGEPSRRQLRRRRETSPIHHNPRNTRWASSPNYTQSPIQSKRTTQMDTQRSPSPDYEYTPDWSLNLEDEADDPNIQQQKLRSTVAKVVLNKVPTHQQLSDDDDIPE
jgi:hypothetical protein